jgi:hypothetical protein
LPEVEQHDVITTGLELDRLAGRQLQERHLSHSHHAVFHFHLMHFRRLRHRAPHAGQTQIFPGNNFHVDPADLLSWHRSFRPRLPHLHQIGGMGRAGQEPDQYHRG